MPTYTQIQIELAMLATLMVLIVIDVALQSTNRLKLLIGKKYCITQYYATLINESTSALLYSCISIATQKFMENPCKCRACQGFIITFKNKVKV